MMKKGPKNTLILGFLVNPIAGMGGRVGLKGTDGMYEKALELGAKPVSPKRAVEFLKSLSRYKDELEVTLITCPGQMGEEEAKEAQFDFELIDMPKKERTGPEDTKLAVSKFVDKNVELIVFVGGDGTARDVMDALRSKNSNIPVLGVPSGVKMYSGIFAINPQVAAEVIAYFAENKANVMELEVMDIDEEAFRKNELKIKLYGYMKTPYVPMAIQGSKSVTPNTIDEHENQLAIARYIIDRIKEDLDPDGYYILGPGTTVKTINDLLGIEKTLLGVDIYHKGKVYLDVNERQILEIVKDFKKAWIIVSPIGHQGMIFGRGNQQISPEIIKRVGKDHIIVIATMRKIRDLADGALKVDTGDPEVDNMLRGYIKVLVDYQTWRMVKVI